MASGDFIMLISLTTLLLVSCSVRSKTNLNIACLFLTEALIAFGRDEGVEGLSFQASNRQTELVSRFF